MYSMYTSKSKSKCTQCIQCIHQNQNQNARNVFNVYIKIKIKMYTSTYRAKDKVNRYGFEWLTEKAALIKLLTSIIINQYHKRNLRLVCLGMMHNLL